MEWLNYHHLYYFWLIAREGSLTKAAEQLRLTHSTLSAQLRMLEEFLGEPLFERKGRRLALTPFGAEIAEYAADIFRIGSELVDVARGRSLVRRATFRVGVLGTLPRTIVRRLLEPVLQDGSNALLHLRQDNLEPLLQHLAANRVHVVLADTTPPPDFSPGVHVHPLGETELEFYGTKELARRYRKGFPASLSEAPLVLPSSGSGLRRDLDRWLASKQIRTNVVCEVNDAGLMRSLGVKGYGLFPVRSVLGQEVEEISDVFSVGRIDGVLERYYAISTERRVRHPLVAAVIQNARERALRAPSPGKARSSAVRRSRPASASD
jgi:LysR family transcriptional activator of nhaA